MVRIPEEVFSGNFNYGFDLGLMEKDCGLAATLLRSELEYGLGFDGVLLKAEERIRDAAMFYQKREVDYTYVSRFLEEQTGETLRTTKSE